MTCVVEIHAALAAVERKSSYFVSSKNIPYCFKALRTSNLSTLLSSKDSSAASSFSFLWTTRKPRTASSILLFCEPNLPEVPLRMLALLLPHNHHKNSTLVYFETSSFSIYLADSSFDHSLICRNGLWKCHRKLSGSFCWIISQLFLPLDVTFSTLQPVCRFQVWAHRRKDRCLTR